MSGTPGYTTSNNTGASGGYKAPQSSSYPSSYGSESTFSTSSTYSQNQNQNQGQAQYNSAPAGGQYAQQNQNFSQMPQMTQITPNVSWFSRSSGLIFNYMNTS